MSRFLKVFLASIALSSAAGTLAIASPIDEGIVDACQAHDLTRFGMWDCR